MSTRTIHQWICDRSGRFIEEPGDMTAGPDLSIAVPWVPTLEAIVDADAGGARGATGVSSDHAIFDDLGNRDRLVVAKIIARVLKIPEAQIVAAAIARDGRPLVEALELDDEAPE